MIDLKKAYDAIRTPDWALWLAVGLKGVFDTPKTVVINVICPGKCSENQEKKGKNKMSECTDGGICGCPAERAYAKKYVRINEVDAYQMKFGEFKMKYPKSGGAK